MWREFEEKNVAVTDGRRAWQLRMAARGRGPAPSSCQAVDHVRSAYSADGAYVTIAMFWAEKIAADDSSEPLKILLRQHGASLGNVIDHCRLPRTRNILRRNGLADSNQLLDLTVRDLWDLRNCGLASVIDILAAVILTLATYGPPARK